jgi:hypothetical protein
MDASELIRRGASDVEIAQKLELKDPEVIPYLRRRLAEIDARN